MLHKFILRLLLTTFVIGSAALVGPSNIARAEAPTLYLDFKGADVRDVLRLIALQSGVDIAAAPEVVGSVTVHLEDVTLEEALHIISRSLGYTHEVQDDVYYVFAPPGALDLTIAVTDGRFDIDARAASLQSLIESLAALSNENLVVPPTLDPDVTMFTRSLTLDETLQALAKAHDLYWVNVGNVHFIREREPILWIQTRDDFVSLIASDAALGDLVRLLTIHTGFNVTASPAASRTQVSVHGGDLDLEDLLSQISASTGLRLLREQSRYHFELPPQAGSILHPAASVLSAEVREQDQPNVELPAGAPILSIEDGSITLEIQSVMVSELAPAIATLSGFSFLFQPDVANVPISGNLHRVSFPDGLAPLFEVHGLKLEWLQNDSPPLEADQPGNPGIYLIRRHSPQVPVVVEAGPEGLTLHAIEASLHDVVQEYRRVTGTTVIVDPQIHRPVSLEIGPLPGSSLLDALATATNTRLTRRGEYYLLLPVDAQLAVEVHDSRLSLSAREADVRDVLGRISELTGVNIAVGPNISGTVTAELNNVTAEHILEVLSSLVGWELFESDGTISVLAPSQPQAARRTTIGHLSVTKQSLSLSVQDATVREIVDALAKQTSENYLADRSILDRPISGHLESVPLVSGLRALLHANGLALQQRDDHYFITAGDSTSALVRYDRGSELVTVEAQDQTLSSLLRTLADQAGVNLVLLQHAQTTVNQIRIHDMPFDEALEYLLKGSPLAYRRIDDTYLIGDAITLRPDTADLTDVEVIALQFLSTDQFMAVLPPTLPSANIRVNKSQNSIVATGSPAFLRRLREFIATVDRPNENVRSVVIKPNHISSTQLAEALSSLLGGEYFQNLPDENRVIVTAADLIIKAARDHAALVDRPVEPVVYEIIPLHHLKADFVSDLLPTSFDWFTPLVLPAQNAVIASGTSRQLEELIAFLTAIDAPTPLIQFDVMVVELTSRNQDQFGLLATDSDGAISFDLLTPSPLKLTFGTNPILGADFVVTLNTLIQTGEAKLLANPTLSTLSGHEASFQVVTKSRFWDPGSQGDDGNQGNSGTRSGFHSVETGIKMRLKPWVSASRDITIEIEPEISDAAGSSSGGSSGLPQTNERAVRTTVRVRDGETIIIGGLIQNTSRTSVAKLPILGHLPILGKLFTSTSTVEGETEFIIYITPRLLD